MQYFTPKKVVYTNDFCNIKRIQQRHHSSFVTSPIKNNKKNSMKKKPEKKQGKREAFSEYLFIF